MGPTSSEVLAASRRIDGAWLLPPGGDDTVVTDDFVAHLRPAQLTSATSGRVQVRITSARPLEELQPAIDAVVRGWGADEARWRLPAGVAPGAETWLRESGAMLVLTEHVMARALTGPDADSWLSGGPADGVSVVLVADRPTADEMLDVETAGWGWPSPSADRAAQVWDDVRAGSLAGSEFAFLGSVDGVPASVSRCKLFGPVARLYGSVTLPAFRRRGLYGALLRERCRVAREHGATTALTKARSDTSAPVLRHAGFDSHGTERSWLVTCR